MAVCYFKCFESRRFTEVKALERCPVVIGNDLSASLYLELEERAKLVVRIDQVPSGFAIEKVVGKERVLLNGRPIHAATIKPGDVLTIDTYDFGFYVSEPSATVVPPLFGRIKEQEVETVIERPSLNVVDQINEQKIEEASEKRKKMQEDLRQYSSSGRKVAKKPTPKESVAKEPESIDEEKTEVTPVSSEFEPTVSQVVMPPIEKEKTEGASKESLRTETKKVNTPVKPEVNQTSTTVAKPKLGQKVVVEVSVVWEDRVLETKHYEGARDVVIGGHEDCDIRLPVFAHRDIQHRVLQVGVRTRVFLTQRMKGDLLENGRVTSFEQLLSSRRLIQEKGAYALVLDLDEQVTINLPGTPIKLVVRYVKAAPKPFMAPLFDLTASEMTGLLMSMLIAGLLSVFVSINAPQENQKSVIEMAQPIRYAQLVYDSIPAPPEQKEPEPPVKKKKPEPPKKKVKPVELAPLVKKKKQVKKKKSFSRKSRRKGVTKKQTGESKRIRPKRLPKAPKKVTSIRKGRSKKIAKKAGASASTKKKDVSQVGVLGILANKGYRDKIDKAASGLGVLTGLADKATGSIGEEENLDGELRGKALKDDGRGGLGLSTVGIENIGTKGLGTGNQAYGRSKIGDRVRPEIKFGGDEEDFVGKIDREAIRRVIRSHENQVINCYEQELNKDRTLSGKIVIEWKLGVGGKAISPRVVSSTMGTQIQPSAANPDAVGNCIVRRLASWRFPEPPPSVVGLISYPFILVSRQ